MTELKRQFEAELERIRQVGITEEYRKDCLRVTEGCGEISAFAAVVDKYPGQDVNLIIDLETQRTALMICSDAGHDQVTIFNKHVPSYFYEQLICVFLACCRSATLAGCRRRVCRHLWQFGASPRVKKWPQKHCRATARCWCQAWNSE